MNNSDKEVFKNCPNCKRLSKSTDFKKFEVRANGKVKILWRCPICEKFKKAAKIANI